jgi:hypothetical protein
VELLVNRVFKDCREILEKLAILEYLAKQEVPELLVNKVLLVRAALSGYLDKLETQDSLDWLDQRACKDNWVSRDRLELLDLQV